MLLEHIQRNYKEFTTQVTKMARDQGWTNELINAALKSSPKNSLLLEVALVEPLRRLMVEPPNTSSASGGEVARALGSLIEMLNNSERSELRTLAKPQLPCR